MAVLDIDLLRKVASAQKAESYLAERFGPPPLDAVTRVLMQKAASADPELLRAAAYLDPEHPIRMYEELGGSYI